AARDAPARVLVPPRGLETLAALLEMMGEQGGVRRGRGTMDRKEGTRDRGMRAAPAVQELRAVGYFLGERVPEGARAAGRLGGRGRLRAREPLGRWRKVGPRGIHGPAE